MTSTGDRWRLGHRPALDGLRGVAILLVLACHTLTWPLSRYGDPGVDLFFALSGFLITTLLLEEHARHGRVSLRGFYVRRARRLLPALIVFVVAMTALRVYIDQTLGAPLRAAALVLGYVGNWAMMYGVDVRYLGQTWSLSVEEQFYVLWPLVLLLLVRFPRNIRLWVCAGLVGIICTWRGVAYVIDPTVIDEGSVGRAAPLVIGCALAFWLNGRRDGTSRPRAAFGFSLLLLVIPWVHHPRALEHVDSGLVAGAVIMCATMGRGVRWLEWAPLRLVGRRSYGLYLWHYPVLIPVMSLPLTGWDRVTGCILALTVAWVLTHLSWHLVEKWFLRRHPGSVGAVELLQQEPDDAVVLPCERLDLSGDLRVRR